MFIKENGEILVLRFLGFMFWVVQYYAKIFTCHVLFNSYNDFGKDFHFKYMEIEVQRQNRLTWGHPDAFHI